MTVDSNKAVSDMLRRIDEWRSDATMLAVVNPIGFYVLMGCTLPSYIARIDDLEKLCHRIKEIADGAKPAE